MGNKQCWGLSPTGDSCCSQGGSSYLAPPNCFLVVSWPSVNASLGFPKEAWIFLWTSTILKLLWPTTALGRSDPVAASLQSYPACGCTPGYRIQIFLLCPNFTCGTSLQMQLFPLSENMFLACPAPILLFLEFLLRNHALLPSVHAVLARPTLTCSIRLDADAAI